MSESQFEFELNSTVQIDISEEQGIVIGRAEFLNGEDRYQLRYCNPTGEAVERWWRASALTAVED
jgi:hypothetical protein